MYRFGPDVNGNITELQSGYTLKTGERLGDGISAPCGAYNGRYTNDYEFTNAGDLDECNGIQQTITLNTANGTETFDYFYVITDSFPQIARCFMGTPDFSFGDGAISGTCSDGIQGQGETAIDCGALCTACITDTKVNLKFFLEAPYNTATAEMTTELNTKGLIPFVQPFNVAPYNYNGSESIVGYPSTDIVDWVLVQAYDANNWETIVESKACFVLKDGTLMDTDGTTGVAFSTLGTGIAYRFALYHKGHLGILTAKDIIAGTNNIYDLTTDMAKAQGVAQTKIKGTVQCLYSGDYDNNGIVNNLDYNQWTANAAAVNMYLHFDADCNGVVNNLDYNAWEGNRSKIGETSIALP